MVIPLEDHMGARTKIRFKCANCEYEWATSPDSVLRGTKCRKCNGTAPLTTEEFKKKLSKIHSNLEVYGEYVNIKTKLPVKCLECGYEWEATPASLSAHNRYNGNGCPNCYGHTKKTIEDLSKHLMNNFPDIELLDNSFKNAKSKVNCKCGVCEYIIDKRVLPFDFYLPDYNILIKYQGRQHYQLSYFGDYDKEQAKENLLI